MALSTPAVTFEDADLTLRRLRALARLLDDAFPIPGTNLRVGIDPLLGLVPGLGDAAALGFSAYIIAQAKQLGASPATIGRMTLNAAVDALVGTIPLLGDLFDAAWKANARNLDLLEEDLIRQSIWHRPRKQV